jgi:hypothetical protein
LSSSKNDSKIFLPYIVNCTTVRCENGWLGSTFTLAPVKNYEGSLNTHVSLHLFEDRLGQAIDNWGETGHDDLYMSEEVTGEIFSRDHYFSSDYASRL